MLGTNRVWSSFCLEWPTVRSRTPLLLHEDLAKPESIVHDRPMISHSQCCVTGHYFCSYFWSIFNQLRHFPYPTFPLHVYLSYVPSFLCLGHTHEQTTRTSFNCTTGYQQLNLLSYWHPETVLLSFLILRWNPLSRPHLLPQLKVPDFPDTECE